MRRDRCHIWRAHLISCRSLSSEDNSCSICVAVWTSVGSWLPTWVFIGFFMLTLETLNASVDIFDGIMTQPRASCPVGQPMEIPSNLGLWRWQRTLFAISSHHAKHPEGTLKQCQSRQWTHLLIGHSARVPMTPKPLPRSSLWLPVLSKMSLCTCSGERFHPWHSSFGPGMLKSFATFSYTKSSSSHSRNFEITQLTWQDLDWDHRLPHGLRHVQVNLHHRKGWQHHASSDEHGGQDLRGMLSVSFSSLVRNADPDNARSPL